MTLFTLLLLAGTGSVPTSHPDAAEIVRRSLASIETRAKIARSYTFLERNEQRQLDSDGRPKSRKCRTFDVTLLDGSPYRRLVKVDDKPLSAEDEKKEEEKLQNSIAERRKETESQRAKRVAEWEQKRKRQRELAQEVAVAFDFTLAGEAEVEGRRAWILDATPRRGYKPRFNEARIFPKLKGRIWIDQQDFDWVKVDAEIIDTFTIGWFLARLQPGAHVSMQQTRVNHEIWLPQRITLAAAARLALVKKMRVDLQLDYSNYRKFQSDSRVVSTTPL